MNTTLTEHFAMFINERINLVDSALENNTEYQRMIDMIDKTSEKALNITAISTNIAEKTAYRLGFLDGLKLMATLAQ